MPMRIIQTLYDADRERRVLIFQRDDKTFGFEKEYFSIAEHENCWVPRGGHSTSIFDSEETALREVYSRVTWLTESDSPT